MPESALPFPLPVVPPRFTPLTAAAQNRRLAQKLYAQFFSWPIERSRKIIETTPAEVWEREGQKRALQVFHAAAERVPAYKDFLKKHKVNREKVRTIADFRKVVPLMDKENYLRKYPLADLCWDGVLASTQMISVSSGATGDPFFWPRGLMLELETSYLFELLFREYFGRKGSRVLFANCWALGLWVGGTITLNSMLRVAQKRNDVLLVTPGNVLEEVLRVLPKLGPYFDEVILAAYPPFLKDVLDEGRHRGVDWKRFKFKFLLAGEGINETWRDYIAELVGIEDPGSTFVSLYGTTDAGALGHETINTISIRRFLASDAVRSKAIFGSERLPSLLHFYPTLRFFEVIGGELHFSSASGGLPLVRYNIHDEGGVIQAKDVLELVAPYNSRRVPRLSPGWELPMVYLFGRSDFTATLYGANVYPEHVKAALERRELRKILSGRFVMLTETDRNFSQYLSVNIELTKGLKSSLRLRRKIQDVIVRTLLEINSEYRDVTKSVGKKARPHIRLYRKGDKRYFGPGIKQRWKH